MPETEHLVGGLLFHTLARGVLIGRIKNERDRWTNEAALAKIANFDAATGRIEADIARRTTRSEAIGSVRRLAEIEAVYRCATDAPS
jgi:hypothetical protein